jgi:hypothetical protein
MNLNTFGPVGKLEGVMCLLIVARCWCYCANQLKIHTHKVYGKEGLVLAAVHSRSFSQPPSVRSIQNLKSCPRLHRHRSHKFQLSSCFKCPTSSKISMRLQRKIHNETLKVKSVSNIMKEWRSTYVGWGRATTEIRPWPLKEDCKSRVSLESR